MNGKGTFHMAASAFRPFSSTGNGNVCLETLSMFKVSKFSSVSFPFARMKKGSGMEWEVFGKETLWSGSIRKGFV
jgi:hypothetical protein